MQGRDPCFENLRKHTLNFSLLELQILSDTNQEINIFTVFRYYVTENIFCLHSGENLVSRVYENTVIQKITGLQYCY